MKKVILFACLALLVVLAWWLTRPIIVHFYPRHEIGYRDGWFFEQYKEENEVVGEQKLVVADGMWFKYPMFCNNRERGLIERELTKSLAKDSLIQMDVFLVWINGRVEKESMNLPVDYPPKMISDRNSKAERFLDECNAGLIYFR